MRLDRFIANITEQSRQTVRALIAGGRVSVAGEVVREISLEIDAFVAVALDGQLLQSQPAYYFMLNKPVGCVSATRDPEHPTVVQLFDASYRDRLHIGGRLDRYSSGLMLLTNDGKWSRRLTEPNQKVPKTYLVTTEDPVTDEYVKWFAEGMHFPYEGVDIQPAHLQLLDTHRSRLTIYEGRYHQVKRMYGRFGNKVVALHRERMGDIVLDAELQPGQYRALTDAEIKQI